MTTEVVPNLNQAADELIRALEVTAALVGLRDGIQRSCLYFEATASSGRPDAGEAADVLRVWRALDDLAAAIAMRRGL